MKNWIFCLTLLLLLIPNKSSAQRQNVNYWYIKDFQTEIVINKDSSIDVVENIVADAGTARKHGIFRILPTVQYLEEVTTPAPITLKGITDFEGNRYQYQTIRDRNNNTLTWKIGSENIYVTGENNYQISYRIDNAIRHHEDFDEFYWNLTSNFWDIPIDNFSAKISFPEEITQSNIETNIYSGKVGEINELSPQLTFIDENTIEITYNNTLETGEGITLSATFPDGIIDPYVPSFWEKYGLYFLYLIPLLVLMFSYFVWERYGKDPKINPTIAPEFDIPENLAPIEMGLVLTDGQLKNDFISAGIINLAVKGHIKIKKSGKKSLFGTQKYEFEKVNSDEQINSPAEKELLNRLFISSNTIKLSDLKNRFYKNLPLISRAGRSFLYKKNFLLPHSPILMYSFITLASITIVASFFAFSYYLHLGLSLLFAGIILLIFAPLMRKRNIKGHELLKRIKGFKLYMDKAEKYRQQYFEKESIEKKTATFEKLLPYAIMFGITKEWIKKMKDIYGEQYFKTYHPVWFYGAGITSFDASTLSSQLSTISSDMASTMSSSPSSSGSGGGGFSGGGGGGGGGGGW